MTNYILIDTSTIRRNPDYHPPGTRHYRVGISETTFHGKGLVPKEIENHEDLVVTDWPLESVTNKKYQVESVTNKEYYGVLYGKLTEDILDILKKYNIDINSSHQMIDDTQINSPEFLYEYENTKVKCQYCKSVFLHKYLYSEWTYDGGGHSDTICPVCDGWGCCNVEYETLEHALERIGKTKETIN